jgi:ABC-type oligopeptide transport system substrate-binding subunit
MTLVFALATPAMAEKVLKWASRGDALTYDPHSANESPTNLAMQQVYETLAIRNPKYEIVPCLEREDMTYPPPGKPTRRVPGRATSFSRNELCCEHNRPGVHRQL